MRMCVKSKDYVWEKNGENVSGKGSHALSALWKNLSLTLLGDITPVATLQEAAGSGGHH